MDLTIIIEGDIIAGVTNIIGPFGDQPDAIKYAEDNIDGNWYTATVTAPDNPLGEAIHKVLEVAFDESVHTDQNAEEGQVTTAEWYYNDMQLNFARREEQGVEEEVTVWVTEHDDEDVAWVINDVTDMNHNFDDLVKAGTVAEGQTFEDYLDTWERVEVPKAIYHSDALVPWVTAYMKRHYTG